MTFITVKVKMFLDERRSFTCGVFHSLGWIAKTEINPRTIPETNLFNHEAHEEHEGILKIIISHAL